ncbi:hypothetical protein ACFE04_010080 [Oxalis oulophora]
MMNYDYDSNDDSDFEEKYVINLDRSNFNNIVFDHPFVAVGLTWCSDFKDFDRKFEKVGEILSGNDRILLAKVDGRRIKVLAAYYNISCYPTILIFKDRGKDIQEYKGPLLDAQGIADYLETLCDHFPTSLEDVTVHKKVATCTEYHVDPPELVANFFSDTGNTKVMLFINRCDINAPSLRQKYHEVAKKNRKEGINFMLGVLEDSQDALSFFELHKGTPAPLIAIRTPVNEIYWEAKLTSEDDIETFIQKYKAHRLSIPREEIGLVKEVAAQSFQNMVVDSGKNVFLEVGPLCKWCEHCRTLVPVLVNVANHYKNDPNVFFAKLTYSLFFVLKSNNNSDIRREDLDDDPYAAKDRPTLYFKKASRKKLMIYHGFRAEERIIEFIETNRDNKDTRDNVVEITSLEDVYNLMRGNKIVIVGIFSTLDGQKYDTFSEIANKLKLDYEFRTLDASHLRDGGVCSPFVRLYNPFISPTMEKFFETNNFDGHALAKFCKVASIPTVTIYDEHPQVLVDNFFYRRYDDGVAKAMLFINRNSEDASILISQYMEVAENYKEKDMNFMLGDIDTSKDAFRCFDLESSREPLFVILNSSGDRYVKENLKNNDDIDALVKEYKDLIVEELIEFVETKYLFEWEKNMDIFVEPKNIYCSSEIQSVVSFHKEMATTDFIWKPERAAVDFISKQIPSYSPESENLKVMLFVNRKEGALCFETKYEVVAKKYEGRGIEFMSVEFDNDVENLSMVERDAVDFHVKQIPSCSTESENLKVMLFVNRKEGALCFETKYEEVAKKYEGRGIEFMSVEFDNDVENLSMVDIESNQSIIVIVNSKGEVVIRELINLSDNIEEWLEDYKAGRVAKYKQSIRLTHLVTPESSCGFKYMLTEPGKSVLLVLKGSEWIDSDKLHYILSDDWLDVECDLDFRYTLTPVLHAQKTFCEYDEPTIYFVKKYSAEIFDGVVTGENIIKFITESMSKETLTFQLNDDWNEIGHECISW